MDSKPTCGEAAAHRALADRREAAGVRDALRLLLGVSTCGNDDALGAVVEHARGVPVLEAGDAHDGVTPTASEAAEICAAVSRSIELCSQSMNSQSKPAGLGDLGDVDGARLAQAQADGELAGAQLAQGVVGDGAHGIPPSGCIVVRYACTKLLVSPASRAILRERGRAPRGHRGAPRLTCRKNDTFATRFLDVSPPAT